MTTMTSAPPVSHCTHEETSAAFGDPPSPRVGVIGGVDTHRDQHVAAALDSLGRLLGIEYFDADTSGHRALLAWLESFGPVLMIGIEGTGAYGLGLARHLATATTADLIEVDRPDRRTRRLKGKSDPVDAEAAARAAWSGAHTGTPKARDGRIEALRNLRVARRSAVQQRADVVRQIKALIVTAEDDLRHRLRHLDTPTLVRTCAALRPDPAHIAEPLHATKAALRSLARRHRHLSEEITDLEALIHPLVEQINPALMAINGIGHDCAGQLLVTAGANPERIHTEAAFAMLVGTAPVPASSGQTHRTRLNRGGDRQANAAIHRVLLSRMRWHKPTKTYLARRVNQRDLSKREAARILKRYITREIYPALINPHHGLDHP
ncbi:Transposase IS116/IS110/IS902 family protein [Nocardioides dokdonensis FR1436]|uniref:Transposase IS116/IS110/IS902 family protein n=1 Tax=Nocardioides dokdonensis FR1436 TaxID=1300347 RepID=A0A1A9GIT9_9ACTN|nr:IS110 family transposase [Nocardioides dokdonensis]ANH38227.1 Transposase IS116/IS110/IS902 family protein [Nocardioides dokdonensis FR1436]